MVMVNSGYPDLANSFSSNGAAFFFLYSSKWPRLGEILQDLASSPNYTRRLALTRVVKSRHTFQNPRILSPCVRCASAVHPCNNAWLIILPYLGRTTHHERKKFEKSDQSAAFLKSFLNPVSRISITTTCHRSSSSRSSNDRGP